MGLFDRGDDDVPEREKLDRHEAMKLHSQNQNMAARQSGKFTPQYLDSLLEDDHHLETPTLQKLSILLSREWKLGNLEAAEVQEAKWIKRAIKKQLFAMHPPANSPIQGEYRKFLMDDEHEGLTALSQRERNEIEQILLTIVLPSDSRSRDGWQQQELSKTHAISEVRRQQEQKEGGGLFGFR